MNKEKFCVICKEKILEETERWVRLTDFYGNIQGGEVYYHLECWRERFKITNSERKQKMYKQVTDTLQNIINPKGGGIVTTQ